MACHRYCSDYHSVAAYRRSYDGSVTPSAQMKVWGELSYTVLPPNYNIRPGRPRKMGIRDEDEERPTKMVSKKCSNCGQQGHNRRKCKGPVLGQNDPDGRATQAWFFRCRGGANAARGGAQAGRGAQPTASGGAGAQTENLEVVVPNLQQLEAEDSLEGEEKGEGEGEGEREQCKWSSDSLWDK